MSCFTTRDFSSRSGRERGNIHPPKAQETRSGSLPFCPKPQCSQETRSRSLPFCPKPQCSEELGSFLNLTILLPAEADGYKGTEVESVGEAYGRGSHTVGDDTAQGGPFEVKLDVHVLSLHRETRESLGCLSLPTTPVGGLCAVLLTFSPSSPFLLLPYALQSSPADVTTHKSRGVVIADGLGIAKCCGDEER